MVVWNVSTRNSDSNQATNNCCNKAFSFYENAFLFNMDDGKVKPKECRCFSTLITYKITNNLREIDILRWKYDIINRLCFEKGWNA